MMQLKDQGLTDSPLKTGNAAIWHLAACFLVGSLSGFFPSEDNVK